MKKQMNLFVNNGKRKIDICECCGAKKITYKHKLNKGLVSALATLEQQENHEGKISKIGLTHNQIANFQKLKYWCVIEKRKESGVWAVTLYGRNFLSGAIAIFDTVLTYRGKFVKYSEEAEAVKINSYFKNGYEQKKDYIEGMV